MLKAVPVSASPRLLALLLHALQYASAQLHDLQQLARLQALSNRYISDHCKTYAPQGILQLPLGNNEHPGASTFVSPTLLCQV